MTGLFIIVMAVGLLIWPLIFLPIGLHLKVGIGLSVIAIYLALVAAFLVFHVPDPTI